MRKWYYLPATKWKQIYIWRCQTLTRTSNIVAISETKEKTWSQHECERKHEHKHIWNTNSHTYRSYWVERNSSWGYQPIKSNLRHFELTVDGFVVFFSLCLLTLASGSLQLSLSDVYLFKWICSPARTRMLFYRKHFAFTIDNDKCMQSSTIQSK